jgi:ethanolamine transporter EutH
MASNLPAAKNKAASTVILIMPMVVMTVVGVLVAFGVRWAAKALSSAFLSHSLVFAFIILSFAFMGFFVGLRSIVAVRPRETGDADGGEEKASNVNMKTIV